MTKKFWTSLVLGLTLSTPALMVGCGEESKPDAKAEPGALKPAPTTGQPGDKPDAAAKTP